MLTKSCAGCNSSPNSQVNRHADAKSDTLLRMENNNPIREHYYGFVTCGLIAVISLLLFVLRVPIAFKLALLLVAAIIVITILSKAGRATGQ
jgi:hypothetical protein